MPLECEKRKVVRKRKGEEESQRRNDYFIYKKRHKINKKSIIKY